MEGKMRNGRIGEEEERRSGEDCKGYWEGRRIGGRV